ncbi:MAG: methionyl-tRNA formyltransferase [Clostridia bacterium]|nr:methionyl-tRNA formyltransferase [Clostridia bacterium]
MKLVFMGTPDFSVSVLKAIMNSNHEITAVVTQPDKQKGRGKELAFTPVKQFAVEAGIPVLQPQRIKSDEAFEELSNIEADIFVVVAYGQILSKRILDLPKYGCINVHASLLPKYRGAAPIQWAILDGEAQSGVTIMQLDEGMDTGDMLLKQAVPISPEETGASLHDKLAETGAILCVDALNQIEEGTITRTPQNGAESSYAKMLTKQMGKLHFNQPAAVIERKVRGLNSWPSAYMMLEGKILKIWKARVSDQLSNGQPGTVAHVSKNSFSINTSDYQIDILEVQPEGKKRMDTACFLLGHKIEAGSSL